MVNGKQLALSDATEWLGDWHPLAEQLGSAVGLVTLGGLAETLRLRPLCDVPALRAFLGDYHQQVLLAFELPAIQSAYGHACGNELRELVALDCSLGAEPMLQDFAAPSRRVGQSQLQRLRPLRDQRIVQRYLHAVESGLANGWHTLVYGLTLSVYSLPLRQGLIGYAHQTTRGFIYSAARMLSLSERDCRAIFDQACENLPGAVDTLVRQGAPEILRCETT
jgi:urease accessory protein UreF